MAVKKILVVEDDMYFRGLIGEMIKDFGYEMEGCSCTEEALEKAHTGKYALLIVDAMLPNNPIKSKISEIETRGGTQAGVAVIRRIKEKGNHVPAILITGFPNAEVQAWCRSSEVVYMLKPIDRKTLEDTIEIITGAKKKKRLPVVFVVHGQDEKMLKRTKQFIVETLKFQSPIILREQAGKGRTIIEGLENYCNLVDIVFVLLTPDDKFCESGESDEVKRRARQNVIFELGLFYGYLGRLSGKVILLHKGKLDLPSDIQGIIYTDISKGIKRAEKKIRAELSQWL